MSEPRVALITGAAGALGRGLIEAYEAAGWRVAAGARTPPVTSAPDRLGLLWDVTAPGDAEAAVQATLGAYGRLDCLVCAAGVVRDDLLALASVHDWDRTLAVNLKGAFLASRAAAKALAAHSPAGGAIVFLGSFAGRAGSAGQTAYASAKAALSGLATSLARELAAANVRVNVVLPGAFRSGVTAGLSDAALQGLAARNALGRLNDVPEIARFVVHLSGMQNVSGQLFQLDSRIAPWS